MAARWSIGSMRWNASPTMSTVTNPVPDSTTVLTRSSGSFERSPTPAGPPCGPASSAATTRDGDGPRTRSTGTGASWVPSTK